MGITRTTRDVETLAGWDEAEETNPHAGKDGRRIEHRIDHEGDLWIEHTWEGKVVGERERNMPDDSDGFAIVWHGDREIEFPTWTTRGVSNTSSRIDATPEVVAEHKVWEAEMAERVLVHRISVAAAKPDRGKVVEVIKGRKVPVGTRGLVFWIGPDKFRAGKSRVGIRAGEAVHWTAADNVRVV